MFNEYKPQFYINVNAENNNTYIAENATVNTAEYLGDGLYKLNNHNANVKITSECFEGTTAVRQTTTVTNNGDKDIFIDTLSSLFLTDLGSAGKTPWNNDRFIIHYAHTAWQGEAQWRHETVRQAGLYDTYNHHSQTSIEFYGKGSWSTSKFEPFVILEDTELKKSYWFEIETGSSWHIGFYARGHRTSSRICVFVSNCFEKNDGWCKTLKPGESITTAPAAVGYVDGGFEEAVADATAYRRRIYLRKLPDGVPPLCFNDYMNCLWALPTREKLIPLIDAAAMAGAEYFVIDAGWFGKKADWNTDLGDWCVNDSLFGNGGFKGIIDYIKSKGMKPGAWLEIESASTESDFVKSHPKAILYRHGAPIGGSRVFLDFENETVRKHIMDTFDMLYDLGVRYVKNDYNQSIGIGCDKEGISLSEALRNQHIAVMSFLDELAERHPDLMVENCGSGAMRSDNGTLSHFALQSSSDQEDYLKFPSIIAGSEACIAPERLGIWPYPYPLAIDYRENFKPNREFAEQFQDGMNTVFNMVNGLMGLIYLSGHIDCCDDFNMKLIQDAGVIYKRNRSIVINSYPIYPTGTFDMSYVGVAAYGLINRKANKLLLAVWSIGDDKSAEINLSKYADSIKVADVYPKLDGFSYSINKNKLSVELPSGKTAMYFEIEI